MLRILGNKLILGNENIENIQEIIKLGQKRFY